jgi:uncharacterized membrane protein
MKQLKIIWGIILIYTFLGCEIKKEYYILNSVGKEWRLDKMNDKLVSPNFSRTLYIIFHKNNTYDIYYKKSGERYEESTDNIIDQKWFFDKSGNLLITTFSVSEFKLVQLDDKNLVFQYGKEKYAFVCDECE